jgi:amino acid transporter
MTTATRRTEPATIEGDQRHRLTALTGMAGLGLDAIASVAYGPETIVLVLAAAGSAGIGWTLPVTLGIVVLLVVLIACYRQIIQAFPDGGGAYTVASTYLGRRAGLVAAASLVVDYVLNVAVSVAAGVAALTSAFPDLLPWTTELCLLVLVLVTAVNLRGVVVGARAFAAPAAIFVGSVLVVIVVGLVRGTPLHALPATTQSTTVGWVGILLVLSAFGNGCSALTGVEAIANATPSFRSPRRQRARCAEAGLGLVLGVLLLGLAALIQRFDLRPVDGRTILSLVTEGALGDGFGFVVVQLSTVVLLTLAANTSFGGLPVLTAKLARDDYLPHVFGLRADRLVHRHGVFVLATLAGVLLLFTGGQTNVLVPLFAIGVFVGFALAQIGMVRHWLAKRGQGWVGRTALNGFGAVLTIAALIDVTASKILAGAWLIVLAIPIFVLLFSVVQRAYERIGKVIGIGTLPVRPRRTSSVVVVPVVAITQLTAESLSTALSMGDRVVAVHVTFDDELDRVRQFQRDWQEWRPEVPLVLLDSAHRVLGPPIARYVKSLDDDRVVVLIGEIEPASVWERMLRNRRGAVVARCVGRNTDAVVCRLRFRLGFSKSI